jgi:hypothetical protein
MNPQLHAAEPTSLPMPIDPGLPTPVSTASASSGPSPVTQAVASGPATKDTNKSAHTPDIAEDVDLIEKEWVEKAKHIVAQTKNDPREQNLEMSKLKADYMKKRYDKDLEIDSE